MIPMKAPLLTTTPITTPTPTPTPPTRPTRVLCVDDNRDITEVMQLVIGTEPRIECVGCMGSADGLIEAVRGLSPPPDVVLLDATMPGRSPLVVMSELAAEVPAVRTIIYSGYTDAEFIARAKAAGAWGYVSKNEDPDVILRAVLEV